MYVSGDAYVDHPSFGAALITRVLEAAGFKVAMLSQPDWHNTKGFYTVWEAAAGLFGFLRQYRFHGSPLHGGEKKKERGCLHARRKAGKRPDRAVIVYCQRIREAYGTEIPLVIGGLEASLRRFAHYDYWDDAIRPSILFDSGADLLIYGMGENQVIEIARRLDAEEPVASLTDIRAPATPSMCMKRRFMGRSAPPTKMY